MTTAQEAFATMMKEQIAPALRELGFKGSGQTFALRSETHWAQVGFQKSAWSDARTVRFTVNVQCIDRGNWDDAHEQHPWLPRRPSPNSGYPGAGWWTRIGKLAAREDVWWEIEPGRSTEPIVREVIELISNRVVPELRRRMT